MNDTKSTPEIVDLVPLNNNESLYIKPMRIHYRQNGKDLIWDCIKSHDCVSVVIYNTSRNVLVFVRQFRPPVYLCTATSDMDVSIEQLREAVKQPQTNPELGYTLELCAGIIDKKGLTPQQIALEEVIEETGYSPSLDSLELITSFRTAVGHTGSLQYLYYCQVDDTMRINKGGGVDDENIEVIELDLQQAKEQIYDCDHSTGRGRTAGFRFGLCWFFYDKYPSLVKH